jgi:hypothetical protein
VRIEIRHQQLGALLVQDACQPAADAADPLNRHTRALDAERFQTGPHALPDTLGGVLADVAQAGRRFTGDISGGARHRGQVLGRGAHVHAGEETPAEIFDHQPERFERSNAVESVVIDQHDLATAARQLGQRSFVGHGAGEPQSIVEGFGLAGVAPDPGAAQRRAQRGVVDGQEPAQAAGAVLQRNHLLVVLLCHSAQQRHTVSCCTLPPECNRRSIWSVAEQRLHLFADFLHFFGLA